MILQILQHSLQMQEHLTQYTVVQKELRQLVIKSHMWNIAFFIIKTNFEEIVENWATVKQG